MKNITIDEKFKTKELYLITKLPIIIGKDVLLISLSTIRFLESDGNYTHIHTTEKETSILSSRNLKYYDVNLPKHSFIRIHKGFIVNIHFVKYIRRDNHWKLELIDKIQLNVSDEKKELILQTLGLKYE
jgi:two-component system LytT family response regulator